MNPSTATANLPFPTRWTPTQEIEARRWFYLETADNPAHKQLWRKLENDLGEATWEALREFVEGEPEAEPEAEFTPEQIEKAKRWDYILNVESPEAPTAESNRLYQ